MRPANVDRPGVLAALQRFWHRSYAADYLGLILLVLANAGVCLWHEEDVYLLLSRGLDCIVRRASTPDVPPRRPVQTISIRSG